MPKEWRPQPSVKKSGVIPRPMVWTDLDRWLDKVDRVLFAHDQIMREEV